MSMTRCLEQRFSRGLRGTPLKEIDCTRSECDVIAAYVSPLSTGQSAILRLIDLTGGFIEVLLLVGEIKEPAILLN